MSYRAMDWAFEQECRDSFNKLVLVTIAKHADDKGQCFPSVARIAKLSNMSPRTVQRRIAELREDGFIRVTMQGKGGKQKSNLYQLVFTSNSRPRGDQQTDRGVQQSPEYINNKSDNISSSIRVSDSHPKDEIDFSAMAEKAMKGKPNGKNQ